MKQAQKTALESFVLTGVVGIQVNVVNEGTTSVVRITDREEFLKRCSSFRPVRSDDSSSHFDEGEDIHTLHIFDFDGTLCNTADRDDAQWEYQRLTGKVWPHRDFFSQPESLQAPINYGPGPALAALRQFQGRRSTRTLIVSGRTENTRDALVHLLGEIDVQTDRIMLKPTATENSVQFKTQALLQVVEGLPTLREVKIWEDDIDAIKAYIEVGEMLKATRNIIVKVANALELADKISVALKDETSSIKIHLRRSGLVLRSEEQHVAQDALQTLTQLWLECLTSQVPQLAQDDLASSYIAQMFGSFPLGRRSDLDVCLLAPNGISAWNWISAFSETLKAHGIHYVYAAHSDRCPRLKVRLYFDKSGPVEFDFVIACLPMDRFKLLVSGVSSLEDALSSLAESDPARIGLSGPLFLKDAISRFEGRIQLADVACLIDFTKQSLIAANLSGMQLIVLR